jgi:hypothetical protein
VSSSSATEVRRWDPPVARAVLRRAQAAGHRRADRAGACACPTRPAPSSARSTTSARRWPVAVRFMSRPGRCPNRCDAGQVRRRRQARTAAAAGQRVRAVAGRRVLLLAARDRRSQASAKAPRGEHAGGAVAGFGRRAASGRL